MLLLLLLSHFSRVRLFVTPWTAAYQAPPSMGFSRQEYLSGVPLPFPRLLLYKFLKIQYHMTYLNDKMLNKLLVKKKNLSPPERSVIYTVAPRHHPTPISPPPSLERFPQRLQSQREELSATQDTLSSRCCTQVQTLLSPPRRLLSLIEPIPISIRLRLRASGRGRFQA